MSESIAKRGQTKFQHNYIILMTSQAKLKQRDPGKQFSEPEIDLGINLETLHLEITNNQLQQIISIGERLQKYSQEVKRKNTQELSSEQLRVCKHKFGEIFPDFYTCWGKEMCPEKMKQLEDLLERLEVSEFYSEINAFLQGKEKERIVA